MLSSDIRDKEQYERVSRGTRIVNIFHSVILDLLRSVTPTTHILIQQAAHSSSRLRKILTSNNAVAVIRNVDNELCLKINFESTSIWLELNC